MNSIMYLVFNTIFKPILDSLNKVLKALSERAATFSCIDKDKQM